MGNGDCDIAPDESTDKAHKSPEAGGVWDRYAMLYLPHAFEEDDPKKFKVRDYDHITGYFIGAAYRQCNQLRSVSFWISVFFHNFRGYHALLILHELGKRQKRTIIVINQNMEKYLQLELGTNMVFQELLQFLPASLKQLTTSLVKTGSGNFYIFHEVVA